MNQVPAKCFTGVQIARKRQLREKLIPTSSTITALLTFTMQPSEI
jgi:hypothetical protein